MNSIEIDVECENKMIDNSCKTDLYYTQIVTRKMWNSYGRYKKSGGVE